MTYKIKDWDKHFENNRTRELKRLLWVPFPNKQDGDGYTELIMQKDGAAYFGSWCAICQVASKCDPRGTLLRDSKKPHDLTSLSRITRIPIKVLRPAIERLLNIGWLESYDNPAGECGIKTAPDCVEGKGREGKGIEGNGRNEKASYGEFKNVKLSTDEYEKLKEIYGDKLQDGIEILDTYLETKGKKYKSHYAVMKKDGWVYERTQENAGNTGSTSKTKPTSSNHKPVTIWELKQRMEAIDELISSLKSVLTSSYAADNKKAHPKEFAKLQELKSQRMDILKQMGECGK